MAKKRQTILVVDDSVLNRAFLSDILDESFDIIEAENGHEAIAALQRYGSGISLVLLDYVMPVMDGFGVLEVMNKNGWINTSPVIMISSETDPAYIEKAFELGVTDFIPRPFDINIVRRRVTNTLVLYDKQRALVGMVADQIYERERSNNLMIYILSHIVEFRNGESGLHVLHVSAITEYLLGHIQKLTDKYQLTSEDIDMISMASSLHDVGKIAIPEHILNKPGRFTDEEFEIMKTHSAIGAEMLEQLETYKDEPLVKVAHDICRWHHERWDGRGYPDGLKGDEIPISAQVVALADVYDALTSKRVYKPAFSHEEAIKMILNGECGEFNPLILQCLREAADGLHMKIEETDRGTGSNTMADVSHILEKTSFHNGEQISSRTVELLDYERLKYHFYASMSNEVQFEYTSKPSMLVFSDWSEHKLGLPEIIMHPETDDELARVFGADNLAKVQEAFSKTTPENPVTDAEMEITLDDDVRWFHMVARAMWKSEDAETYDGVIGKLVDIDERTNQLRDLRFKAYHDPLTGVVNRAFARKVITTRLEEYADSRFVIALADLDLFKQANDTRGHQFGDKLLKHFAMQLKDAVRSDDIVARIGGDEFLICLRCPIDPQPLIKRIHSHLGGEFDGFPVSVSIGVAVTEEDVRTYEDLFARADTALYKVKTSGRGAYAFYEGEKVIGSDFGDTIESDARISQ